MSSSNIPTEHKAVYFEETGESLDVVKYGDLKTPQIQSPTDVIIKNRYAGVNFIEAYFRKGIYPIEKPAIFGREATGEVAAVGSAVTKYKVGDKVAYLSTATFAEYTKISEDRVQVIKLESNVSDEKLKLYAAILVQGLTALTFVHEAHPVQKGEYVAVWAAAGGVGGILVQLLAQKGAHVIAIASTEEKLNKAKKLGAEYAINYHADDIAAKVKEITDGKGVDAVFDSVGKETFETSFEFLARKGTFVSCGNASGVVPPLSIGRLASKNIKLLRPQLFGYVTTEKEWSKYSKDLFGLVDSGALSIALFKTYPLKNYKTAAEELESRKTTGKIVLSIPE